MLMPLAIILIAKWLFLKNEISPLKKKNALKIAINNKDPTVIEENIKWLR